MISLHKDSVKSNCLLMFPNYRPMYLMRHWDLISAGIPQRGDLITSSGQIGLLENKKDKQNKQMFQVDYVFCCRNVGIRGQKVNTLCMTRTAPHFPNQ
jgi:hypothetical protein